MAENQSRRRSRPDGLSWLFVLLCCVAGVVPVSFSAAHAVPNLTPYQPSEWSDRIVVSVGTGTNTDSSPLRSVDTLYLDWAVLNGGDTATGAQFTTELYVDGALRTSWVTNPPLEANFYVFVTDYELGSLGPGTHTLRIKTDANGALGESNEDDNEYTKTITVSGAADRPNLTPYQPTGWSDEIVVSTGTGTNTDTGTLRPADMLYVDWAVINDGTLATAARFITELYVDGERRTFWFSDPPLEATFYAFVQDYALGSLSAGTHTLTIKTDATGAIAEGDEADNEYTKTIVVEGAAATPTPTLTPTPTPPGPLGCTGDCDGSRDVAVNEIVKGVNIALGTAPLAECLAFDTDSNGQVSVNELIQAVNAALNGCSA